MKVTVLGCGASWGVPAIGPDWGRCDPTDPRNRRRRCSVLVETQGRAILIDTALDALAGIELWVVDCLRREAHPTHANLGKVLGWVERLRPKRTVLTHMDQSLDYRELSAELPAGVEPGHDGLAVELPDS